MNHRDAAKLGGVLASAERPSTDGSSASGVCGLCDRGLAPGNGDRIVEVDLRLDESDGPDAWLCRSCYGYVVAELGIAPTRVFKAGRHRTVVLPIVPDGGSELGTGSD